MPTSLRSILATLSVLAAGACNTDEFDEATAEQGLSTYHMHFYYSDENMTQLVGERSSICTSVRNWGVRTQWVYDETGSCEERRPPDGNPNGGGWCFCCWDTDGNGHCSSGEGPFHYCSDSLLCQ